tara:strand:- start:2328 stop:2951 length:624 start_codon:yes stop_codon:yes gene_type:complete
MAWPNPFISTVRKLKKLTGAPSSTIKKWCTEKTKQMTPNPAKPWKKKTIKDKILELPNLQKLLIQLKDKLNEVIDQIEQIPELEERVYNLEGEVFNLKLELARLTKKQIDDVDELEKEDDRLEAIDRLQDIDRRRINRKHDRHKHQYGPPIVIPTTPPIIRRNYTKGPRRMERGGEINKYDSGGRTRQERQSLIKRIRNKIKSLIGR